MLRPHKTAVVGSAFVSGLLIALTAAAPVPAEAADPLVLLASVNSYGAPNANDVAVVGNYAYLVTQNNSGLDPELYILDISMPQSPVLVGSLNIAADVNAVFVVGNTAYLATTKSGKQLDIVDVTNKAAPVERGGYNTGRQALAVYAQGTTVYVGTANNPDAGGREFFILDASTPAAPTLLGSYEVGADVNDLVVNSTTAFLATSHASKELCLLNVSTPSAITPGRTYDAPGSAPARGVVYTSGKTYLVTDNNNSHPDFYIFSANLDLIGALDLQTHNTKVAIRGSKAFVSTLSDAKGLTVVDLTTLTQPQVYATFNTGAAAQAVALNGPHVYLATKHDAQELQIVDPNLPFRSGVGDVNGDGLITIACLGDSNTSGLWWSGPSWCEQLDQLLLPATAVTNEKGFGGATAVRVLTPPLSDWIIDGYEQLSSAIQTQADVVVMAFGTNDLGDPRIGATPQDVVNAYTELKSIAEASGLFVLIAFTPPTFPPVSNFEERNSLYDQLNALLLSTFPADRLVDFRAPPLIFPDDYMSDGIHMNVPGQAKRALQVYDQLIAK